MTQILQLCGVSEQCQRVLTSGRKPVNVRVAKGLNRSRVHLHCHFSKPELAVLKHAPGPETLVFAYQCERVVFAAGQGADLHVLEADDSTRDCDVRCYNFANASTLPCSLHCSDLHLLQICIQTQLAEVVDTAPIQLVFVRKEQCEHCSAMDLHNSDVRRHRYFGRFIHSRTNHPVARLKRVRTKPKAKLAVHAHAPSPYLAFVCQRNRVGFTACNRNNFLGLVG